MKPLPHGVCRNYLKPKPTHWPYCVEQPSFLSRRIPVVGSPVILERSRTLSHYVLKNKAHYISLPFHVFGFLFDVRDDTILYFVLLSFKNFNNANYVPKLWIFDIWHYLGLPFPSFLYSFNISNMSTCYK